MAQNSFNFLSSGFFFTKIPADFSEMCGRIRKVPKWVQMVQEKHKKVSKWPKYVLNLSKKDLKKCLENEPNQCKNDHCSRFEFRIQFSDNICPIWYNMFPIFTFWFISAKFENKDNIKSKIRTTLTLFRV